MGGEGNVSLLTFNWSRNWDTPHCHLSPPLSSLPCKGILSQQAEGAYPMMNPARRSVGRVVQGCPRAPPLAGSSHHRPQPWRVWEHQRENTVWWVQRTVPTSWRASERKRTGPPNSSLWKRVLPEASGSHKPPTNIFISWKPSRQLIKQKIQDNQGNQVFWNKCIKILFKVYQNNTQASLRAQW